MPTSTVVPHTPTSDGRPSAPTEQVSGSGKPTTRVPLPTDLLDKINSMAAKNLMPGQQVQGSDSKPLASDGPAAAATTPPIPPAAPTAAPAGSVTAKLQDAEKGIEKAAAAVASTKKDGIAQVREALERAEARAKELEGSLSATTKEKADAFTKAAELEAKVKGYDEKFTKEYEPQLKRLGEREKQAQLLEEKLRTIAYTETPEFHNAYVKPIVEADNKVQRFLKDIGFVSINGQDLPANMNHFNAVLSAPTGKEAMERAKSLFGPDFAAQAVGYRSELIALHGNREAATKQASVDSETYFKKQQDEQRTSQARFNQRVQERATNYLVKPADNDPEEAAAIQKGRDFGEQVERGTNDPEAWAESVAKVKGRVESWELMELRNNRLKDELAAAKAELARYQKTEPDVTTGGSASQSAKAQATLEQGKTATHDTLMAKVRQIAKGRV